MLIDLRSLVVQHRMNIVGVIHVGAHTVEEKPIYDDLGIDNVLWIEGNKDLEPIIKRKLAYDSRHKYIMAVVSDGNGESDFNITNQTGSSSLLGLGLNKTNRKGLKVDKIKKVKTHTLDVLFDLYDDIDIENYNMLNLDIQGAEMKALHGFIHNLKHIDYIYTEVHTAETYVGVPKLEELDRLLGVDFKRVEMRLTKYGWGDALYKRR